MRPVSANNYLPGSNYPCHFLKYPYHIVINWQWDYIYCSYAAFRFYLPGLPSFWIYLAYVLSLSLSLSRSLSLSKHIYTYVHIYLGRCLFLNTMNGRLYFRSFLSFNDSLLNTQIWSHWAHIRLFNVRWTSGLTFS